MSGDNRIDIYTIPPNFAEEGTILSGRVKTRTVSYTHLDVYKRQIIEWRSFF